jgi:hypothetical protein
VDHDRKDIGFGVSSRQPVKKRDGLLFPWKEDVFSAHETLATLQHIVFAGFFN